jgi:parallel beta-helix repeat protein
MYSHSDAPDYIKWTESDWNERKVNGIRFNGSNNIASRNTLVAVYHGITSTGSNNLFERNVIDGFNGDGMRGLGPGNTFLQNTVKNCVVTDQNHDDGFQAWVNSSSNPSGLVIDGNTILEWSETPTNHPLRCRLQGIGLFDGIYRNITIVNNVVSATQYHGISVYGADNAIIANNTVVNSTGNPSTSPYILIWATKSGLQPTNILVANNLAMSIRGTPSVERNVVFKNNSILTYPQKMLMDVLAFNFRPKANSGLLDTGDVGSAPKFDILGVARPRGGGVDRGAYEGSDDVTAP